MYESHVPRVRRILDKLSGVRSRKLTSFGSETHAYRLQAPLPEAEVQAFESRHGVRLPEDYRVFLLHAGNGGAGPYHGLYPLERWDDFVTWTCDDVPADVLALPCPLRPGRNEVPESGPESLYHGTLSLGSQGCTYAMQLVVSGAHAGRVVYADADGQAPYMCREPDFLSWYERWLDELLGGYVDGWFGYGPGGGEEDFFRILDDPEAEEELQSEAAAGFARLPRLSDAAAVRLGALCAHRLPGVRSSACGAIEHFAIQAAAGAAGELLEDPVAAVRQQAVKAVMKLEPQRWSGAVQKLLRAETDEEVAATQIFRLKDAQALPRTLLVELIVLSPLSGVRSLATCYVEWSAEDRELLITLLNDPDPAVRRHAVLAMKKLEIREALPALAGRLACETDVLVIDHLLTTLGELGDLATAPALLKWCAAEDDFHRLAALEGLARIGDERAMPFARVMLADQRKPERRSPTSTMSNVHSIADLARKSLQASPSRVLRSLA